MRRLWLVATSLAVVAACSTGPGQTPASPTAGTHIIKGTVLVAAYNDPSAVTCQPITPLLDIQSGVQVLFKDQGGSTVATSNLVAPSGNGSYNSAKTACVFVFEAFDVPDATFYSVSIGGRSGPTYSRAELEANNWEVTLTLG